MSAVSLPVTRPQGRALVIGNVAGRARLVQSLERLGFDCLESDDPYSAVRELSRRRTTVSSLIISLACLFREELIVVSAVRQRFPQVEVWLAHTDGRQSALAEAVRLGAAGLVDDEGLHRMAASASVVEPPVYRPLTSSKLEPAAIEPPPAAATPIGRSFEPMMPGEPVLTAEELRALLQEAPLLPSSRNGRES